MPPPGLPSPHGPVEAVRAEAMAALCLERPPEDVVAAVAQVFVLQLVAQDLLGEAGLVALHGGGGGRLLRGHGVLFHTSHLEGHGEDFISMQQSRGNEYFLSVFLIF